MQSQVAVCTEPTELTSHSVVVASTHSTGIPEATVYAGQVFYERANLLRFAAAKDLNALIQFIKKEYRHLQLRQDFEFQFDPRFECLELVFGPQDEPITGWTVSPDIVPCQIKKRRIDKFGSKCIPPSCLVSIYAENSPDTVHVLKYDIPLKGLLEPVKIKIKRSLKEVLDANIPKPDSQNDIKKHLNDLKHFLSSSELSMFRDIANGCKNAQIISPSQHDALFDEMNRKPLLERVEHFMKNVTNTLKICPDQISAFQSILKKQEHVALSTLADRIAASLEAR